MHVDEMTVLRDSSKQCWPIQGRLINPWLGEAFVIDLFYGGCKPTSVEGSLANLIAKLDSLLRNGRRITGSEFAVSENSQAFSYESSVRAYVKQIKSQANYHGCDNGRAILPHITFRPPNDEDLRGRRHWQRHRLVPCRFETLPIRTPASRLSGCNW
ncbi:hypothetical protein P879_11527 [Paragonimus westermani]|uniref:Uncharacterized protein n=1 Tax=Paragonimus westermani TaxID=34504 RepID=A0A8T0D3Z8_9TREM|nr:hypothetical protein P879_11527 [Paragonimus westermani]